jgi:hypothetical protein
MTRARLWGDLIELTDDVKMPIVDEQLIAGQIIDPMGKTRVFVTDEMSIILFRGYPPINTERVDVITTPRNTVLYISEVIKTVSSMFPHITEFKKIVDRTRLIGVEAVGLGIIPWVAGNTKSANLEVSDKMEYLYTQIELFGPVGVNLYDETKRQRRIADHLRQLTVAAFSRRNEGKTDKLSERLEVFTHNGYEIEPRVRDVAVFNRRLDESTLIRDGKILVPNVEVKTRLLYHLEAFVYSNPRYVELSMNQRYINFFFETSEDFSCRANESVFGSVRELYLYLQATYNYVMSLSDELVGYERLKMDGYAFRKDGVERGKTFWIQPVKFGSLARAIGVVTTWADMRVNPGFYSEEMEVDVPYKVVDMTGRSDGTVSRLTVLQDGDQYLAMNPID